MISGFVRDSQYETYPVNIAPCLLTPTLFFLQVVNGAFTGEAPDNDHNGKVPKGWKSMNGLRIDTLSADVTLQGQTMLVASNNGGTFMRLNSNNIIIKQLVS